jgi:hypothetical protein
MYTYFGLILMLINAATTARLNVISNTDCFPFKDDPNALVCRSIPSCNSDDSVFSSKYTRFVFDLENRYDIHSKQFYNCTFFQSTHSDIKVEFIFKNIKFLNSYAFDSIIFRENTSVSMKFDGSGLNLDKKSTNSRLVISKSTFNNILFEKNARINIEIKNYDWVEIGDMLTDNGGVIWQHENSEINFDFKNIDQLIFRSNFRISDSNADENKEDLYDDYKEPDADYEPIGSTSPESAAKLNHAQTIVDKMDKQKFSYKNNLTYSLFASNVDGLVFEEGFFSKIRINPYSNWIIQIKFIKSLFFGKGLFDGLMLGYNANFNLFVENVNTIGMDKFMFSGMQQEKYSVFYFYLEKIGPTSSPTVTISDDLTPAAVKSIQDSSDSDDYSSDYSENDDDSSDQLDEYFKSKQNIWLCLPEGLFENILMAESTVTQVHFTQIDMSVSVSNNTFRDITLDANSKFQIMFQDLDGHVIFDENSINTIKLGDGQFEIWVDNQKQRDPLRGKF